MKKRVLLVLLLAVLAAAAYVNMQKFPAPSQAISQELPRETFIPAE